MSLIDGVREQVVQLAGTLAGKVADTATADSRAQSVTIARPRDLIVPLFQDPHLLSAVFGDVAEVTATDGDRLRWKFPSDHDDAPEWECAVTAEDNSRIHFADAGGRGTVGLVLDFRDAPQGLGTEVTARVSGPAPGALTGALAYKALYRARALIMTGEVPTIKHNPGARDSAR